MFTLLSPRTLRICTLFVVFLQLSCKNEEIGGSKDVNPETVYFDYAAWGDEEGGDVTLKLQYRFGGSEGTTLVLDEPSNVTLDGEPIPVDSSSLKGAYYEVTRPVADFAGEHTIVFTDIKGKKYSQTFRFPAFSLAADIPGVIGRDSLGISLAGVDSTDYIKVLMTDTSSYSQGIDTVFRPKEGRIVLPRQAIARLSPGPIHLVLYNDRDIQLSEAPKEGGRLSLSYNIKRELELKEQP